MDQKSHPRVILTGSITSKKNSFTLTAFTVNEENLLGFYLTTWKLQFVQH